VNRAAAGGSIVLSTARVRRLHRLLGVVIGVQVLLWTTSGIYFAWTDIDEIRGDHLKARPKATAFDPDWVSPTEIDFSAASIDRPRQVQRLDVVEILGEPHYRLRVENGDDETQVILASARSGIVRGPLLREEAVSMARASFAPGAEILDVAMLTREAVGAHHE
jgi:hypothetical protein